MMQNGVNNNDYYSAIAPGYDNLYGAEQDEKLKEFISRVELRSSMTLLDVGCGTGRSARLLDVHWFGIEPARGLIQQASPEIRSRIKEGVGENLPFSDASFDIVLSLTALQNFEDPEKGMLEMKRVCKPNGLFMISFLESESLDKLMRKHFEIKESWRKFKDILYFCRNPQHI